MYDNALSNKAAEPHSADFLTHPAKHHQLRLLACLQGSCGYGDLQKEAYPFWSVAALSTSNRFYKAGPGNGCGECFEIQCQNSGGQFPVSFAPYKICKA